MRVNKIKEVVNAKFTEFVTINSIEAGTVPVPADTILNAFQNFAPTVPVNKASLGRVLTKYFLKRQVGTPQIQCYFLNKNL